MIRFLPGVLIVTAVVATAAPTQPSSIQCASVRSSSGASTLDAFLSLAGGIGCVDADKQYYNFEFTPTGTVAASDVQVQIASLPNDEHTVVFQSSGWTTAFQIAYNVYVTDPTKMITSAALAITAPDIPGAGANVSTLVETGNGGAVFNMSTVGTDDDTAVFAGVRDLRISNAGNPVAPGTIKQVTNTLFETVESSAVPEPATYALMGAGLFAIGMVRRYRG